MIQMIKSMASVVAVVALKFSASLLFKESKMNKEKNTPFECGWDSSHMLRMPFSLQFFIPTMIFLMFDIEVATMLPPPFSMSAECSKMLTWNTILFITSTGGLVLKWEQGAMKWI